jgi:lipopolysaccharide export system protein LptA
MSMPRCCRSIALAERLILPIVLVMACSSAQAMKSDSEQPVLVSAHHESYDQDKGILVLTESVTIDQGSFHADGDKATGYQDPNDSSQWERVVLTGNPAHFHQKQDNGTLVHGEAQTVDYKVSENIVVLTGNAIVVQEGRGEFHGAKLTYNTDTGQIVGEGGTGGQVHMILQPKKKAPPAAKPAAASSAATAPAQPATTAPAKPASSAPALDLSLHPATASSTR